MFHNICQNSKLKKNPSTLYHVDKLISAGLGIFLDLTAGIVPCMKSALLHCKVTRVLHNKNDAIERENQYLYKTSCILTFKIYYKRKVVQGIIAVDLADKCPNRNIYCTIRREIYLLHSVIHPSS